jgi:predicted DsbA family dithiol-disulfide isomerase
MESSILVDRAHSLMEGLKTLFADHDIEVPDESEDVLEGLMARNEELVEKLNDAHKTIMALTEEAEQDELEVVLEELVKGLTTTQAEKLKTLAEGIRYKDAADFRKKLEDVKGAFFKDEKSVTTEAIDEGALDKEAPKSTVHADADAEAIVQAMKNKQR